MARYDMTRAEWESDWIVVLKLPKLADWKVWDGEQWVYDIEKAKVFDRFGEALGAQWDLPEEVIRDAGGRGTRAMPRAVFRIWRTIVHTDDPKPEFFVEGFAV